jgi:hypothetical protein
MGTGAVRVGLYRNGAVSTRNRTWRGGMITSVKWRSASLPRSMLSLGQGSRPAVGSIRRRDIGHTCEIEGCSTVATFRRSLSESKCIRCSAHKEDGMESRFRCKMDGCTIHANYGYAGTGRSTSCKRHKKNGMVYQPHCKKGD